VRYTEVPCRPGAGARQPRGSGGTATSWDRLSILLHLVVAALYAVAAWACWPRKPAPAPQWLRAGHGLIVVALLLHAFALYRAIAAPDGLDLSFAHALSLVGGLAVLVAWISRMFRTLPQVAAVVLPVAAACAALPAFSHTSHRFAFGAEEGLATAHITVALLAYALLVVAALQAAVMTGLEKRLHRGLPQAHSDHGPPLLTLERYEFRLIYTGFALLTLALVSGFVFSEQIFGKPVTFTHKNVFSVAGWVTFAVLLFGRWRYGWRGRIALRWILAGTVLLVLGYLGSKFVLEVVLHRA
jgi:ABC-type uncharacterized transport system permease subunit